MFQIIFLYFIIFIFTETQPNLKDHCKLENQWVTAYVKILVNETEKNTQTRKVKDVKVETIDLKKYVNVNVVVYASKNFKNDQRNEKSFYNSKMVVNFTFPCQNNTSKKLAFYQFISDIDMHEEPKFTENPYVFIFAMPLFARFNTTDFGEKIIKCNWDLLNKRLNIVTTFAENCTVEWYEMINQNCKCLQDIVPVTNTSILHEISTDTVILNINKNSALPFSPKFEFAYYEACYVFTNFYHYFYIYGTIKLINSNPNIRIQVQENYKKYFSVKLSSNLVYVNLVKEFSKDFLMKKFIILLTLEAYLENAACIGSTVLAIYIDKQFLTPNNLPTLEFEQNTYSFEVTNLYNGFIGYVKAVAKSSVNVTYFIHFTGFNCPKQLIIDTFTGSISLTSTLKAGVYNFIVTASEVTYQLKTYANVVINVKKAVEKLQAKNSVMIIHVTEHKETRLKLPCQYYFAVCLYEIIDQYPQTNPLLFSSKLGNLYIAAIDREMDEIVNMSVPQFLVRLRIVELTHFAIKRDLKNREWINVPKIVNNEIDQMLLSIIIDDVNDNPPVFREEAKTIVGYYNNNFSFSLLPYITQVYAKDADSGVNADITYTVNNANFVIHPKTGILYLENINFVKDTPIDIIITATDKNGDNTALSSTLNVTIVPLKLNNLLIITANNTLETLTCTINISIKILTSMSYQQNDLLCNKIVVYALDDNNAPLDNVELERIFNQTGLAITISRFSDDCQQNNNSSCDVIRNRFIIAISTMGIILIIFIVAVFIFFVCRYKKKKLKSRRKNSNKLEAQSIEISISSDVLNHNFQVNKSEVSEDGSLKKTDVQNGIN